MKDKSSRIYYKLNLIEDNLLHRYFIKNNNIQMFLKTFNKFKKEFNKERIAKKKKSYTIFVVVKLNRHYFLRFSNYN